MRRLSFSPNKRHISKIDENEVATVQVAEEVALVLHSSIPPYSEIARVTATKDHFEAGMLVCDARTTTGCLIAAFFTTDHRK